MKIITHMKTRDDQQDVIMGEAYYRRTTASLLMLMIKSMHTMIMVAVVVPLERSWTFSEDVERLVESESRLKIIFLFK